MEFLHPSKVELSADHLFIVKAKNVSLLDTMTVIHSHSPGHYICKSSGHVGAYPDNFLVKPLEAEHKILSLPEEIGTGGTATKLVIYAHQQPERLPPGCRQSGKFHLGRGGKMRVECDGGMEVVRELAKLPEIVGIFEDHEKKIFATSTAEQFFQVGGVSLPGLYNGTGANVFVSDTGLDYSHCAFQDPGEPVTLNSINLQHTKVLGIFGINPEVEQDGGHGDMVASICCGFDCSGEMGVAPGSKLFVLDLGSDASISIPDNFFDLMSLASLYDVRVGSMSWGSDTGGRYDVFDYEIDLFLYQNPTWVLVAAAGNSGISGPSKISSPASAKNVVSVAAGFSDNPSDYSYIQAYLDTRRAGVASFTSSGPTADGRRGPLMNANGVCVVSARGFATLWPGHSDFQCCTGTSCSTPGIAGLAARIQCKFKSIWGDFPAGTLVQAIMVGHAGAPTILVSYNGVTTVALNPDIYVYGKTGLLDQVVGTPEWSSRGFADQFFEVNRTLITDTSQLCLRSSEDVGVRVVLYWRDVPSLGNPQLIDDLDLFFLGPDEAVNEVDRLNPFEYLDVSLVAGITYRIIVKAASTLQFGHQYYSLYINETTLQNVTCPGTCSPGTQLPCTGGVKFCMSDGSWSPNCLPTGICDPGFYDSGGGVCSCVSGATQVCPGGVYRVCPSDCPVTAAPIMSFVESGGNQLVQLQLVLFFTTTICLTLLF